MAVAAVIDDDAFGLLLLLGDQGLLDARMDGMGCLRRGQVAFCPGEQDRRSKDPVWDTETGRMIFLSINALSRGAQP